MSEKKISEKSLANLKKYNQESNQITRESLEISLMQCLRRKNSKKSRFQSWLSELEFPALPFTATTAF